MFITVGVYLMRVTSHLSNTLLESDKAKFALDIFKKLYSIAQ
jgi:hypothetical protein